MNLASISYPQTGLKAVIAVFLGTNCEKETRMALEMAGFNVEYIFHTETNLEKFDLVVLPGGFSFGDYIKAGRLAKLSPVIESLREYVKLNKGFVLGICNGFQILCETRLLPGVLIENTKTKFISEDCALFFNNKEITIPIAHKEGCFWADEDTIKQIEKNDMVILRYKNNPNGSINNIAGLYDSKHHVIGMMPHPERAVLSQCGLADGKKIFEFLKTELLNFKKSCPTKNLSKKRVE